MPYILAPDFTFCEPAGRRIFLDLRGDRYFCLSDEADIAFSALVAGTPTAADIERLEALRRNPWMVGQVKELVIAHAR